MPTNVEIKIHFADLHLAEEIAKAIGAKYQYTMKQIDTYFIVPKGRLKLREIDDKTTELISYSRDEQSIARRSDFKLFQTTSTKNLKEILTEALDILITVEKRRKLYIWDSTRIHLDEVKDLGTFIEFEVPVKTTLDEANQTMQFLLKEFSVEKHTLVQGSYSDLVLKHANE